MSDCPLRNPRPANPRDESARATRHRKELVRRYYDACNAGDIAAIVACLHPGCIVRSRLSEHPTDAVASAFEAAFAEFRDLRWTIEELIADGDHIAALVLIEGTCVGGPLGASDTGRRVRVHSVDVARVRDGLLVELLGVLDELHPGRASETFLAQMS